MELVGMPSPTISFHVTTPVKIHQPGINLEKMRPNTTKISPPRLLRKKKSQWKPPPLPKFKRQRIKPSLFEQEKMQKKQEEIDAKVRVIFPAAVQAIMNASNGIKVQVPEFAVKYRFYITSGNHGSLVKSILKSREGWTQTDRPEHANFLWT